MANKRLSFANFPIPFDHPYILPTLFTTMTVSALAYYSLQASHHTDLVEALRKQHMRKRRHLHRPEDRYASLQIEASFVNPFEAWKTPSWKDYAFTWMKQTWYGITTRSNWDPKVLDESFPLHQPDFDRIFNSIPPSGLADSWVDIKDHPPSQTTFTWLGQSTCLITLDGLTILTDPIFDDSLVLKKRVRSSPCKLDTFQDKIDIVLISHDHVGHLDDHVVKQLGNKVTWYIPLGLRDWFVECGIENVIELDWWQEVRHKERPEVVVASVPSMHSSGRWSLEKNQSLWCNFVIKTRNESLFFCGASGYDRELFKAIGKVYAPLTLAALPIGGYNPRTIKKSLHMDPSEALHAHHRLGCPRLTVGINWGTFHSYADESPLEPRTVLQQTLEKHPLPAPSSVSSLQSPPSSSPTASPTSEGLAKDANEHRQHDEPISTIFTTTCLGETIYLSNTADSQCSIVS